MPDVWATVAELDSATQERLANVLETRGADPQPRGRLPLLEVGCGTGVLTRALARLPRIGSVVGVTWRPRCSSGRGNSRPGCRTRASS